jgi:hypothetical protein
MLRVLNERPTIRRATEARQVLRVLREEFRLAEEVEFGVGTGALLL